MSPYTPPARPSIRVIRSSPFKGGTRTWSNRFFFDGPNMTTAEFNILADALRDDWKGMLPTTDNIVEYVGYDIGSDVPVYTRTVTTAGTYAPGTGHRCPLETCIVVRLTTTQRSVKNHPIYGFKFIHGVYNQDDTHAELPLSGQLSGCVSRLTSWISGVSDGTNVRHLTDARGAVFQAAQGLTYLSHRDFPNL